MYFPFFIAKSYYQTKKKKHLIHYLSLIASLSIGLSTDDSAIGLVYFLMEWKTLCILYFVLLHHL